MSMEASQSKNERKGRRRGGDGKVPEKKKKKKREEVKHAGGWDACIRDVCVLCLLGTAVLLSRLAPCSPPVKTVDAHLGDV